VVDTTDNSNFVYNTEQAGAMSGLKIHTNFACKLIKVTKCTTTNNATKCYVKDAANAIVATSNFVGNDATFDYDLTNNTDYYVVVDKDGAAWQEKYVDSTGVFPVAGTNVNFTGGKYNNDNYLQFAWNIVSVTTQISSGPDFTKLQINIADSWKAGAGMQINIGDAWKQVAGMQINIGDAWKTIL